MRVIAGPEKKTRLLSEQERKITAYHEMGHAMVGHYTDQDAEVHKISIISRGQALGYTISLPREDRYLTTKTSLMDELAAMLGGRAAEELVFNEVTTGAANDIEKVTHTAKQMIMRYGMSEKLGPRVLGRNQDLPFLGREMAAEPDYSEEIAREIDDEIRRVIEEAHTRARQVLEQHMEELHRLSAILVERETIDKDQFQRLLDGDTEEEVFPEEPAEEEPASRRRTSGASACRSRSRSRSRARPCSRPTPKAQRADLGIDAPVGLVALRHERATDRVSPAARDGRLLRRHLARGQARGRRRDAVHRRGDTVHAGDAPACRLGGPAEVAVVRRRVATCRSCSRSGDRGRRLQRALPVRSRAGARLGRGDHRPRSRSGVHGAHRLAGPRRADRGAAAGGAPARVRGRSSP